MLSPDEATKLYADLESERYECFISALGDFRVLSVVVDELSVERMERLVEIVRKTVPQATFQGNDGYLEISHPRR